MKACMVENGMQFDEKEVASLANALFEDAVQVISSSLASLLLNSSANDQVLPTIPPDAASRGSQYLVLLVSVFLVLQDGCAGITVDDLKDQLTRHEGLLENLTISIGKWLVPPRPTAARKSWCQMLR